MEDENTLGGFSSGATSLGEGIGGFIGGITTPIFGGSTEISTTTSPKKGSVSLYFSRECVRRTQRRWLQGDANTGCAQAVDRNCNDSRGWLG